MPVPTGGLSLLLSTTKGGKALTLASSPGHTPLKNSALGGWPGYEASSNTRALRMFDSDYYNYYIEMRL